MILGVFAKCESLFEAGTTLHQSAPERTGAPTPAAATTPAEEDHTEAFRKFVLFDRVREPDWLSRLSKVRFVVTGALVAETTYPANWRDTSASSRPAESICEQLWAYVQRGVRREWKGVAVLAADRTALVTRKDVNGSCRQQ
jgi:hypothetical protein